MLSDPTSLKQNTCFIDALEFSVAEEIIERVI